jgi:hypothetical protein
MYFFENTSLPPSVRVKILKGEREKREFLGNERKKRGKMLKKGVCGVKI